MVEEELELSFDEGYAIFKEEHDSSTLEPIYDKGFTLLKALHDTTYMDLSLDENYAFFYHLGDLVNSPTSYNSMFCNISLNEVWVRQLFLMVPHEEYGTPRSTFYDEMVGAYYYSHLQKLPLLLYDDAHLHGCTNDMHLSHLRIMVFLAQQLAHLMLEELHPKLG